MKNLHTLSLLCFLAFASTLQAQNPFEQYGIKTEVLTLSGGKYDEFVFEDTIVQIGSVLFNTNTNQIVSFIQQDTAYSEATLKPEVISRWLSPDPLAAKYPYFTPYQFANNNPIIYIDPDGAEVVFSKALTQSQQSYIQSSINRITTQSEILAKIYFYMQNMNEVYLIGDNNYKDELNGNFANFYSESNFFKKYLLGQDFDAFIRVKYSSGFFDNSRIADVSMAEEMFHAGQDLYYRQYRPNQTRTTLQDEVEVRVFRAYSSFLFNNDRFSTSSGEFSTSREEYVRDFVANPDVQSYFNALRTNNSEQIDACEGEFRNQVGIMAEKASSSNYIHLNKELKEYKATKGATPFFDAVTKESKMQN